MATPVTPDESPPPVERSPSRPVEWPQERLEPQIPQIAAKIGRLITDHRLWVERRVEQISFVDESTMRRQTSVYFVVPSFPRRPKGQQPAAVALTHVPLALIDKDVLVNLDVYAEDGRALPVLTRRQNGLIAAEVLKRRTRQVLGEEIEPEIEWALDYVSGIAAGPEPPNSEEISAQTQKVLADTDLVNLIRALALNFLLIVPIELRADESRVLKFAHDNSFGTYRKRDRSSDGLTKRALAGGFDGLQHLLEILGLLDFRFATETAAISQCDSYHVEIISPDEAAISHARLERLQVFNEVGATTAYVPVNRPPAPKRALLWLNGTPWRQKPLAEVWATDRAHLYPSSSTDDQRVARALITVGFCLRTSLVFPVLLLTAITSSTLAGALIVHNAWDVSRRGDTAAALVVALPSFFAPFVVPGTHRLVRRMFKGLRFVAIASALVSFTAAATLAVNLKTSTTEAVWKVLLALSLCLTTIAFVAWLHSGWKTDPLDLTRKWLRLFCFVSVVGALAVGLVSIGRLVGQAQRFPAATQRSSDWILVAVCLAAAAIVWACFIGLRRLTAKEASMR